MVSALLVLGGIGTALKAPVQGAGQSPEASLAAVAATAVPTPKPTTAPAAKPVTYAKLTARQWQQIVKTPDNYKGKGFEVWACITQFDAATGDDTFRAQASNAKQEYWYTDGDNALFSGDQARLADFVKDDIVFMHVVSLGSYDYDTSIGGNTTAPLFQVDAISHKGSCK